MATVTEKRQPAFGIGDDCRIYDDGSDGHPKKMVNGKVTEATDEGFTVQWEDLPDPTDYFYSKIEIVGNQIFEQ